jgi:hypothetical protein
MSGDHPGVRLRQAVLVAAELEPVASALRAGLGLGEPFRDPGVAEFGLSNVVFALEDCFLEVISPTRPETAAGRYLERRGGDGGYMAIFDLEDLEGARARVEQLGIRVVWQIDLPDISGTHLHPADMDGAIVSLDRSRPYGSWRWGGPEWTGQIGSGAPGRLAAITVAVSDPVAVGARWARVLGVPLSGEEQQTLHLDGGEVRLVAVEDDGRRDLVEIGVQLPPGLHRAGATIEVGGVRFRVIDAD